MTKHYEPRHPVVFLSDPSMGEPPDPTDDGLFVVTPTCIRLKCTSFNDGGTTFTIAPTAQLERSATPGFDGYLHIPLKKVVLTTAEGDSILEMDWPDDVVRIRVWTSEFGRTVRCGPIKSRLR